MAKLKVRVISAFIGVVLVLGMTFSTPLVFHIVVAAACFIMLFELQKTFQQLGKWQLVALNYICAAVLLSAPMFFDDLMPILTIYLMLLLIFSVVFHETIHFADVTRSFFMQMYAVLLPMYISGIRMMDYGIFLVFLSFLGAWMPDTFAFFAGCLLGKHKLIPAISPKKTVEGSIGAVVGAVLTFAIYGVVLSFGFGFTVHYPALLVLALICGVLAQFGDLAASLIKRTFDTKDFGNLMPGHGGLTDRLDSLLFIGPIVYYFLTIFEVIYK